MRPLEQRIAVAQSTHAWAWLAHGACKFYRGAPTSFPFPSITFHIHIANRTAQDFQSCMVLQSAWVTCTEEHSTSDHQAQVPRRQSEERRICSLGISQHPGSHEGHVLGYQQRNSFAQSTHARAWLAHGACKFYRRERSYIYP